MLHLEALLLPFYDFWNETVGEVDSSRRELTSPSPRFMACDQKWQAVVMTPQVYAP